MKDNLEKIIESAKLASLRPEEKATIRASILHKINSTPIASPFWTFTFMKSYHYVPAFMVLFVFLSGGTSYFAQSSLPGDTLYSMKINVNENVESFLAVSDRQMAEVTAVQATRRLDEAEILAVKGDLKVEQNEEIKNNFSKKVVALNSTFAKMEEKGETESAMEVLNKFDDRVKSKLNTLANISDEKGEISIASEIALFINEKHEQNSNSKVSADARVMVAANVAETSEATSSEDMSDDVDTTGGEPTLMMMATAPAPQDPATSTATTTATSTEDRATSTQKQDESTDTRKSIRQSLIRWEWRHDD